MAKVLLVDTNFSSRPILDEISRYGHEVHVVGGNPSDCLAKNGRHRYWCLNYADRLGLTELVGKEKFDFIVPGCTDRSYRSCAEISNGRFPGIDTPDNEQLLNHKARFRNLAKILGLQTPKLLWQDTNDASFLNEPNLEYFSWPIIVKPVDGFSGKGVSVLLEPNSDEFKCAIAFARSASTSGQCLIEEYIQGVLYSHSANLQSGRVVNDVFVEEHCTANPFVVDTSWLASTISDKLRQKLRFSIETIANHLKLADGLMHTQFILRDEQPWLIELTRRCPGDLYSQLVELSGGGGYVDRYIRPFLGMRVTAENLTSQKRVMRHTVTVENEQAFSHIEFKQKIHMLRWVPLSLTGDHLSASPHSRVGILFAKEDNQISFSDLCDSTLNRNLYSILA